MKRARLVALLLFFALALSCVPVFAAESPVAKWDGSIASGFAGGDGTEAAPYEISSGAELAYLGSMVNGGTNFSGKFFKLTADLDLSGIAWTPIGKSGAAFSGVFIGGGHTIRNLKVEGTRYAGLFGYVSGTSTKTAKAVICDLTIQDSEISGSNEAAAFVAYATYNVTLCNLHCVHTTVEATKAVTNGGVGGIVGYVQFQEKDSLVTVCSSSVVGGSVMSKNQRDDSHPAGGIAGAMGVNNNNGTAEIRYCFTQAETVTAEGSSAGGIAGRLVVNKGTVENCYNTAEVAFTSANNANKGAGGIVGFLQGGNTISACYNTGTVSSASNTATTVTAAAGGIVGYAFGGLIGGGTSKITSCINAGLIKTTNTGTSSTAKPLLGTICGNDNGSCTTCYYLDACFSESNSRYYTQKLQGTAQDAETLVATAHERLTDAHWSKENKTQYPTLTGCNGGSGCTCGCGCYCTEGKTEEPDMKLYVRDGMTGSLIATLTEEEVKEIDITRLAYDLGCVTKMENGISYTFAGWFTEPQPQNDWGHASWEAKSVARGELFGESDTIYAYYMDAGFVKTTIAYTSNEKKASKVFSLATVPGDIFEAYGFVLSTAANASDENLYAGAALSGLPVKDIRKTAVYSWIAVSPFTRTVTANGFNGGLGGANGDDGYITYSLITNIPVGKTLSARAYYETLEGTVVYGSTAQKVLLENANETGLE